MADHPNKLELYQRGRTHITEFCQRNAIPVPELRPAHRDHWGVSSCAYYRPQYIAICVTECAAIGTAAQAWSYPGYVIDRTPYGVLAHELGHHADYLKGEKKGSYWSDYGASIRRSSGEDKLTNYCPNDAEWFAEIFRLFVTNPDLLQALRPKAFKLIEKDFRPIVSRPWKRVLADAPPRTLAQAEKKIIAVRR